MTVRMRVIRKNAAGATKDLPEKTDSSLRSE
jgi:hypothetical protein